MVEKKIGEKKKKAKKKSEKKGKTREEKKKTTGTKVDQALIHNFVNLQKVLTNLAVKFEDMSNNISKLLQLFEISAKSFAEKQGGGQSQVDKDFLEKLDSLLDQNKTISKGIMLMEERVRNRGHLPEKEMMRRPLPRFR